MTYDLQIPWSALLAAHPELAAGPLPRRVRLRVADAFWARVGSGDLGATARDGGLLGRLATALRRPMTLLARTAGIWRLQVLRPDGRLCVLAVNDDGSASLQDLLPAGSWVLASSSMLARAERARTYVLRHADFDTDLGALVAPGPAEPSPAAHPAQSERAAYGGHASHDGGLSDEGRPHGPQQGGQIPGGPGRLLFAPPEAWGFTRAGGRAPWTAAGLFGAGPIPDDTVFDSTFATRRLPADVGSDPACARPGARDDCRPSAASARSSWRDGSTARSPACPPVAFDRYCHLVRPRYRDLCLDFPADSDRGDPSRAADFLRHARAEALPLLTDLPAHPRAATVYGGVAALRLATALGRCRIFGVRLPEPDDFTLAPATFLAAADALLFCLQRSVRIARRLDEVFSRRSPLGEEQAVLELLESRMDAFAAAIALDEALLAATVEGAGSASVSSDNINNDDDADVRNEKALARMSRKYAQVLRMARLLDAALQKHIHLLRPAAGTRLLENWRRLLSPAYRDVMPWWVDGSIEATTESIATAEGDGTATAGNDHAPA